MGSRRPKGIIAWLKDKFSGRSAPLSEISRARKLIDAVDRGGIPLNPARLNAIARDLGLEVSRHAAPEQTIQRIRQALTRIDRNG